MKTKYVCRGLISPYASFHNNRTMWSINLHVKICRWGEKEKEPEVVQHLTKKRETSNNKFQRSKQTCYA